MDDRNELTDGNLYSNYIVKICTKCGVEGHYAYTCIGHMWTSAFGEMPYEIRIFQKNSQIDIEFWGSING